MANIKSIGGNPIVLGTAGIEDGAVTDAKLSARGTAITAGAAEGLTASGPGTAAAWLRRVSTADGPATARSIHGRTVVWNQLNSNNGYASTTGVTATNNDDGSWTLNGTETAYGGVFITSSSVHVKAGHKYLVKGCPAGGSASTYYMGLGGALADVGSGGIQTIASDSTVALRLIIKSGASFSNVTIWPQLFDLTAMFGSGNEPATVAEFEALYPEPYYAYDAGSLLPVNMTGIETTGFNQWDEVWELGGINASGAKTPSDARIRSKNYVPVFPSTAYYFACAATSAAFTVCYYDAAKGFISAAYQSMNSMVTTPADARYLLFTPPIAYGTTYNHDICINLSGPRNGEYEPYWKSERSIPASTYFPDGMRSAGSVYDELTEGMAVTRVDERAYQSGDESDPTVTTDGTTTHYPLASPTTVAIDPPLNLTYRAAQGGTEAVMVPTGELSAPPTMVVAQGGTMERIRDLALSCIAPVEGGIASANYAQGAYLVTQGQLCKVTTAIATGEAITIGTNVMATTVMAEVIALTQ